MPRNPEYSAAGRADPGQTDPGQTGRGPGVPVLSLHHAALDVAALAFGGGGPGGQQRRAAFLR